MTDTNVKAFLRLIRAGETNQDDTAYRMMFGGGLCESLADHPRKAITRGTLTSTAAGAYQFLSRTWDECAKAKNLPDFSPESQDTAAVFLIGRRGALDDVRAGRIEQAIAKCAKEWASLPGSPYGQPTRSLAQALATYSEWGGTFAAAADQSEPQAPVAPIKEKSAMFPTFLAALLPSIAEAINIPALIDKFKPGVPVAERNVAIGMQLLDTAKRTLGAVNEQEVAEKLANDKEAVAMVRHAVEASDWFAVVEVGDGGIGGARKADAAAAATGDPIWHSPSFVMGCLLLPIVYLIVLSLIGVLGTAKWSPDVQAALAGTITGAIVGGIVGYYYGQTTSRNRTPGPPAAEA